MSFFNFFPAQRDAHILAELQRWNGKIEKISDKNRLAKYSKMVCSPFSFYRGSNHLFWQDFAQHPELKTFSNKQTKIWIQGDLHVENFGSFDNDQGEIVYDVNDFDESVIADYQYDLWRLAISLVLVARPHQDFNEQEQKEFIAAFCDGYLQTIAKCCDTQTEVELEFTAKNTYGKLNDFLEDVQSNENREEMLDKWTNVKKGDRYYDLSSDKLAAVTEAERREIIDQMPEYGKTLTGALRYDPKYFHVSDIARRLLAGTGSLGKNRFYVLIEGEQKHHTYDCILDVKSQNKPTAYYYLGKDFQAAYDQQFANDAQRYAIAYKALVKNTDDHLGWINLGGIYYSVRERSPYKEVFPLDTLTTETRFKKLAEQWGKIIAISHSRADQDATGSKINYSFDEAVYQLTNDKQKQFSQLVQKVAFSYADQVQLDWQDFKKANSELTCLE